MRMGPIEWHGPGLAMEVIQARLEEIRASLQPPRIGAIAQAADEALEQLRLLQEFWAAQPPGPAYFQHSHKRLPPTGGFITQQAQVSGEQAEIDEEVDEQAARRQWREGPRS